MWKAVVDAVHITDTDKGYALVDLGTLSRNNTIVLKNCVVKSVEETARNAWIRALQIRISPWQLLFRRIKEE